MATVAVFFRPNHSSPSKSFSIVTVFSHNLGAASQQEAYFLPDLAWAMAPARPRLLSGLTSLVASLQVLILIWRRRYSGCSWHFGKMAQRLGACPNTEMP